MTRAAQRTNGSILIGLAGALLLTGGVALSAHFVNVRDASARGSGGEEAPAAGSEARAVLAAVDAYLAEPVTLKFADNELPVVRSELGITVDETLLDSALARLSEAGADLSSLRFGGGDDSLVPVRVDRAVAEAALVELKSDLDKPPQNAWLDLEGRRVVRESPGLVVDIFSSVSAIEAAVRSGQASVTLEGTEIPAEVTVETLGVEDISTVMSTFSTKFSVAEKTRNDNLKLLASMINGYVLKPGEEFSFNGQTGDRTLEDGFKMAHVITAGEMVDGMAGGSCQISTTLHGASFFGGLDIVRSTPHSRPSTYVLMGLDATVVAGMTDLKLRNPFDFPVVIHYKVARGEAVVELLGKEKPFDKVEFERDIIERINFETVTREDNSIGVGHMIVDQPGYPGYKVKRTRRVYKGGKVIRTDRWNLYYKPVIEYARIGINPDPNLPPPKQKALHGPKPAKGKFTLVQ